MGSSVPWIDGRQRFYNEKSLAPSRIFAWWLCRPQGRLHKRERKKPPFETVSNVSKYDGLDELVTRGKKRNLGNKSTTGRAGRQGYYLGPQKKTKCDLNGLIAWAPSKFQKKIQFKGRRIPLLLLLFLFFYAHNTQRETRMSAGHLVLTPFSHPSPSPQRRFDPSKKKRRRKPAGRPGQDPSMAHTQCHRGWRNDRRSSFLNDYQEPRRFPPQNWGRKSRVTTKPSHPHPLLYRLVYSNVTIMKPYYYVKKSVKNKKKRKVGSAM